MIVEEVDDESRRELPKPLGRRRPDGRTHGNQIVLDELPAVPVAVQVLAQLQIVVLALQQFERLAVEAKHVQEHAVERRPQKIAALGEQAVQGTALIFQAGLVAAHAEAHVAIPRRNVQHLEHADEVGIGPIVEDHEARIGGILASKRLERNRVRVSARVVVGLENVDVVVGGEQTGRKQPANARTNDRDFHVISTEEKPVEAGPRGPGTIQGPSGGSRIAARSQTRRIIYYCRSIWPSTRIACHRTLRSGR